MIFRNRLVLSVLATLLLAGSAGATSVTFDGNSGGARAVFESIGSTLKVTLTNTSNSDVLVPVDVLTAVFFDLPGNPTLSRTSAVLAPGSTVLFGGSDPGGVVGGEWAYGAGLSTPSGVGRQGISSTGVDLFGPADRFPGADLDSPASPNGLNYGIVSAGDDPTTGNQPVTGKDPLISNAVVFTLGDLPGGFNVDSISNVYFQYGTSLDEPRYPGRKREVVPEPLTLLTILSAAGGIGAYLRRRMA